MSEPTRQFDIGTLGGTTPPQDTRENRRPVAWNSGADLGMLLLRLGVGGLFLAHGVQKVFGLWGGLGLDATGRIIGDYGFSSASTLAWALGVGELLLGALLVVGLFTPLAAAGLLAVKAAAITVKWGGPFFAADAVNAMELDVALAAGAAALLFVGAGRIALDNGRTWQRRPLPWALLCLVIGAGVAVGVLFGLR
ncbi:DoxX family membrane protein [Pseudonocardia oroxyli]|uniref:Putative oxidoreductase n=1 Tax=Pseudonocardia oroxyli TaxID=366584 RepID=A0A1G7MW20_PSEOR|nr:DoxX family membrane protein [Pseudonocardia oroxyli]SDF66035.1 putative oxidoreductase [Pseudonocardia oroxyli]